MNHMAGIRIQKITPADFDVFAAFQHRLRINYSCSKNHLIN